MLALLGSQLRELDEDFEEIDNEEPNSMVFPWAEAPRIYAPVPRRPKDLDFKILTENYEVPDLPEIEVKEEEKEEEINLHQPIPRRCRDLARISKILSEGFEAIEAEKEEEDMILSAPDPLRSPDIKFLDLMKEDEEEVGEEEIMAFL